MNNKKHPHHPEHKADQSASHRHEHAHTHGHHHGQHTHEHSHEHAHHHEHHKHGHQHHPAPNSTILTLRPVSGISGDMLLAGLAALAGLKTDELRSLTDELSLEGLKDSVSIEERSVNGISGVGCRVTLPHEHAHRTLLDIEAIIQQSNMPEEVKATSTKAFRLLAEAEGAVHGHSPDKVSFHEVGALDSILDTCLVCRIFHIIKPERFICGPLPLADGTINCAHGLVPSPAPAVLRLLEGVPVREFFGQGETVTPTGLSLLKALGAEFGPWPRMTVKKSVISYGTKVFTDAPNGAVWALGEAGVVACNGQQ